MDCELCRKPGKRVFPLETYPDPDGRSCWYHCPQCGFAGSGLDYLAAVEHVAPVRMLCRLRRDGVLRDVSDTVIRSCNEYRESANALLSAYNQTRRFRSCRESAQLQTLENLDHYCQTHRYRTGDRRTFERLFHPEATVLQTGSSRMFQGRRWGRITAIPLYDLPFRVSGFLFVNGNEQGERPIAVKRLGPQLGGVYSFEPGYLAPGMILPHTPAPDSVVISSDWIRVLRLQTNTWYQEQRLAPIVGWFPHDPVTRKPWMYHWTFFRDIPKIFWSFREDIVNLREACLQNGMVSHAYYSPGTKICLLPNGVLDGAIVRSVARDALTWQKALCLFLGSDEAQIESRWNMLQLPPRVIDEFLRDAPHHLRRIIASQSLASGTSSRYVERILVTSSRDGWHQTTRNLYLPPILLSSARCIVDRVVRFGDRKPMYQGRVLIRDESHPFLGGESEIEKDPIGFIRNVCAENRSRTHPVINTSAEKLLKLIRGHGNFQVTPFDSGFGWDDKTASLILPNMTISDGSVFDHGFRLDTAPFGSLTVRHAEPLTSEDRRMLQSFQEETPYVLAILVSLLPGLFAPCSRVEPPQTAVVGTNIALVSQLFRLLNLPVSMKSMTPTLDVYSHTHRCPYLVKIASHSACSKKKDHVRWVDSAGLHGCGYVSSSLSNALSRMTYGKANLLLLPETRSYRWIKEYLSDVFLKCFVSLLRHFSRYVLEADKSPAVGNADILDEGMRYVKSELGLPVSQSMVIEGDSNPTLFFCDYVNLLVRNKSLTVTESGNTILLPVTELAECFRNDVGIFDFDRIRTMLMRSSLGKEYDVSRHCLALNREPFEANRERLEQIYSPFLRRATT